MEKMGIPPPLPVPRTCISGYQRLNTSPNSPLRVFTRVCNSRCAPRFVHTPSNLVVAHWTSDVKSPAPLDFLLRHDLWTPFGCLISCKVSSIISATCDFTTKSDGIWYNLVPYQRRAQHAGHCGVEGEGGKIPTRDLFLNLQILTSGGFR